MKQTRICVTVTGGTMDEIRRARDGAEHADLVELRLDTVDRPDAAAALAGRRSPVVVTCRPEWEGGRFRGTEEERRRILLAASELGAEFVDVEAAAAFAPEIIAAREGRGVVLSSHLYAQAPEARSLTDTLALFGLAAGVADGDAPHVLVAMGDAGVPTRILSARLRNHWTYAGAAVAPGQIGADRLVRDFRIRRVKADAAVYGVVGQPVMHSLSPPMHNAGFAALGLNAVYLPLQAASAVDFLAFARAIGVRGVSITAPYKVALMSAVEAIDPVARRVGAINTIVVRDGKWIGANTDVEGFLRPLSGRVNLKGVRATVLGAGGAARAVAVALADQRALVTISARRREAAQAVAELGRGVAGEFPPPAGSWDVLVNATSAGSVSDPVNPMEGADMDGEIVFDLVYAPPVTPLLAAAEEAGCLTIGGLEMLVAQAERQFELWTGQRPPQGLFHASATQALAVPQPTSVL
jgi:3-dehydroquinate dehydratase/shikimate dehydrogenase